ncbi:Eukaryotic translation initiation factor 4E-5 [Caenorhabditis elegans]|uniref:Eukaryotic translation initiation factor 4E-5 n=1 Tax=Caenorhabditis elegans TaxID=6239 RepID=IF4E5_CAEEL|nr:Eukaryotic translation initiation factor 4E-5 [Caenorhabditis elegans]P56570.2 RecName: Full=Eukaryotic translation initiation factor 4E-5; Short=eIF-4E-5; Short=eIF4E-5; AltName: Full=eIF-4F 25 kDa subunit; AltName: Full=mRNA cap-binding protein [Caenorhabditis elegans]AAF62415.1 translation initiation factor eIF4E isoform 5 [Caenorhabditis elegans]CAB55035.1 Eukaryotic translation initiation factor 4E-5 [Caenorhabditis elegans]|eukprot:NP_001022479.1 Eukaryotic translation initiation factor 4E-5 [Caenorhabditis elegans]
MTELTTPIYPLQRNWSWWFLNDDRNASWQDRLKKVYTFNTVPEFWAFYEAILPPSGLNDLCDYNVFRDDIQPKWEAPENWDGGRWLIIINKGKTPEVLDAVWLEILLALIGEQFGKDMESICGLVCNVRGQGSKISVWTKNCNDDDTNMRIGVVLKEKLMAAASKAHSKPLFDVIHYQTHRNCVKKTTSALKYKFSLKSIV